MLKATYGKWQRFAKNLVVELSVFLFKDRLQISPLLLNEFKHIKYGFLIISGGIEVN